MSFYDTLHDFDLGKIVVEKAQLGSDLVKKSSIFKGDPTFDLVKVVIERAI